ncbi:MAG: cyclic nucleotide-binding domain-containing protein, partial [bacterium]
MLQLHRTNLEAICQTALAEDLGSGDATTLAVVPEALETTALLRTREDCVCAGLPVASMVFTLLDPDVCVEELVRDGDRCTAVPFVISGSIRVFRTAESGREITLYRIQEGQSCILSSGCVG